MRPIDERQKNLNLRLAEIDAANSIEEAALALKVEQMKQPQAAQKSVNTKTSAKSETKSG